jgi:hypothetical protein
MKSYDELKAEMEAIQQQKWVCCCSNQFIWPKFRCSSCHSRGRAGRSTGNAVTSCFCQPNT